MLTPREVSLPFLRSPARFCVAVTGRRGTKTYSGARKFLERIYRDVSRWFAAEARGEVAYHSGAAPQDTSLWWRRKPRLHYWVVSETHDLLDEAEAAFMQALPPELLEHSNTTDRSFWLEPDVFIEFKSAKDPKRLVSRGLSGAWLEEWARAPENAWRYLSPALADKQGWLIVTTTPLGRNHVHKDFVAPAEDCNPDYAFFTWTTEDAGIVTKEELDKRRATLPPEWFDREYRASFDAFTGQIYARWNAKYELPEAPKVAFTRIMGGADWGMTNPGALVVVGFTKDDEEAIVLEEVYETNELVEQFWAPQARRLGHEIGVKEWVGDPAEPDNLRRFREAGLSIARHYNHGSGTFDEHGRSILAGIRDVSSLIYQGRLKVVAPKCPNLLRELKGYRWDETPRGDLLDRPRPRQSDHAITALRYVLSWVLKPETLRAVR